MKKISIIVVAGILLLACDAGTAAQLYKNTFDSVSSLYDFTIFGQDFANYNPPPLYTVSIESGQLKIETDVYWPNGVGNPPALTGHAFLMMNTSLFGNGYQTIISQSSNVISWSFNISNKDGALNNGFNVVLLSTLGVPNNVGAHGYCFRGGGMSGNRMTLSRFDFGVGGRKKVLIDITNGLGTLPKKGSFKITYDPTINEWAMYGKVEPYYVDPESIDTFLGSAIDGTYTSLNAPFMGLYGGGTGIDYFDNITVAIIPEPSMVLALLLGLTFSFRRRKH